MNQKKTIQLDEKTKKIYDKIIEKNKKLNKIPDGFDIFVYLIKKQNEKLLNKIADDKNMTDYERSLFIEEFLKIGYYMPNLTSCKSDEKAQIIMLRKQYHKIKKSK